MKIQTKAYFTQEPYVFKAMLYFYFITTKLTGGKSEKGIAFETITSFYQEFADW